MASGGGREDSKVANKVFSCNISYIKEKANVDLTRLADKLKAKKIISQPDRDKAVDGYTKQTEAQRRGELIDRVHENLRDGIGEAFEIFLDILREEDTLKLNKLVAELERIYDDEISRGGSGEIKYQKTDSKANSLSKTEIHSHGVSLLSLKKEKDRHGMSGTSKEQQLTEARDEFTRAMTQNKRCPLCQWIITKTEFLGASRGMCVTCPNFGCQYIFCWICLTKWSKECQENHQYGSKNISMYLDHITSR